MLVEYGLLELLHHAGGEIDEARRARESAVPVLASSCTRNPLVVAMTMRGAGLRGAGPVGDAAAARRGIGADAGDGLQVELPQLRAGVGLERDDDRALDRQST